MTEPTDETQTGAAPPDRTPAREALDEQTPGVILPPPGQASAGQNSTPAPPPLLADAGAPPPPADPAPPAVVPSAGPGAGSPGTPPLRADPNRPAASDWREPPWFPPRDGHADRGPSVAAVVVGLVLLAIGLYYLLEVTLGISLPTIRWSSLWPVILIAIGGLIVLRASSRR